MPCPWIQGSGRPGMLRSSSLLHKGLMGGLATNPRVLGSSSPPGPPATSSRQVGLFKAPSLVPSMRAAQTGGRGEKTHPPMTPGMSPGLSQDRPLAIESPPVLDSQSNPSLRPHDASRAPCPSSPNRHPPPRPYAQPGRQRPRPIRPPAPGGSPGLSGVSTECCSRLPWPQQGGRRVLLFTPRPGTARRAGPGKANTTRPGITRACAQARVSGLGWIWGASEVGSTL